MGAPFSLPREILEAARREREEQALSSWAKPIDGLISQGMNGLKTVAGGYAQQLSPFAQALAEGGLKAPTLEDLSTPTNDAANAARTTWMQQQQAQQQQPPPTATGTPSAMPSQPRTVDATIQDGRTTAPSGGGQWDALPVVQRGSHPEKQAEVYREARAAGLDDEGARILVAVTETEGGLTGAIGDQGRSRGPFQFYEGGQMPGFRAWVQQQGVQGDPNDLVHDVRLATRYAATGYLGRAIAAGRAAGLSGADLATYVQQHGQVSVDPWKTGQNYQRLYGGSAAPAQSLMQQTPPAPQPPPPATPQPEQQPQMSAPPSRNPDDRVQVVGPGGGDPMSVPRHMVGEGPGKYAPSQGWRIVSDPRQSNVGAASSTALASLPPGAGATGGPSPASGPALPPAVAERWRQQFGREPTPEEAAELLGVLM